MKADCSTVADISAVSVHEAELIARLAREIWYLHYPGIITVSQIDYMLAQRYRPDVIASQIASGKAWWDKIAIGSRIVGFSGYEPGSNAASIKLDKLYVHPRAHGCGCGYALVRHLESCSRDRGFSTLYLQVNKGNAASIAFYRRAGFAISNTVRVDIGNGFFMDDFVMSRRIGDSSQ